MTNKTWFWHRGYCQWRSLLDGDVQSPSPPPLPDSTNVSKRYLTREWKSHFKLLEKQRLTSTVMKCTVCAPFAKTKIGYCLFIFFIHVENFSLIGDFKLILTLFKALRAIYKAVRFLLCVIRTVRQEIGFFWSRMEDTKYIILISRRV